MANLNPSTSEGNVQWKLAKQIKTVISIICSIFVWALVSISHQRMLREKVHLSSIAAHLVIIPFGF